MTLKSPLSPIFLIVAVDVLGLTIVLPLLPFYAEKYGATPLTVGLLVTVYALCQLISGPILGKMSDTMGRRPLLLVSQVGTFIGFLVLAFSNTLWLVFVSRIIDGVTAGNLSLAQAYISDVSKPEDRAKSFGIIGIAFGLGFLVGPAISGFLAHFGYSYPIFAAALLSLLSICATYFLLPKSVPPQSPIATKAIVDWKAYGKYFRNPQLAPLLKQNFLFFFCFSLFVSGFALFAERRFRWGGHAFGPREVGYVYAYAGLLGVILQGGLIGRLVRKFGEHKLVIIGFASAFVGYLILGYVSKIFTLIIIMTVSSFGTGILRPALSSLVSQAVDRREQGAIMGLSQSLNSFAAITAPILSGYLIEHSWLALWSLAAAVSAGTGLYSAMKTKKAGQGVLQSARAVAGR